jgi:hypothetical protein
MRLAAALLVASLAIAGCRSPTQALVTVHGDSEVRRRSSLLRITVFEGRMQDGNEPRYDRHARLRATEDTPADVALPTTIPVVPRSGARDSTFTVLAEVFENSLEEPPLVSGKITTTFIPYETQRIPIYLDQSCIGVPCDPALTCREGRCVEPDIVRIGDGEVALLSDAQPVLCSSSECFEHPRPGPGIYDVCLPPDGPALAIGSRGVLERRDDQTWDLVHPFPGLNAIECYAGGTATAVGDDGLAIERDASGAWSTQTLGTGSSLVALDGPESDLWALAVNGALLRRLDGTWSSVAPPAGTDRLAVAHDGSAVWVRTSMRDPATPDVTRRQLFVRDGTSWSEIAPPTSSASLREITSAAGLLIVQEGARFFSHDGTTWRPEPLSCGIGFNYVNALAGAADGRALGGGARGGAFIRSPDGLWTCLATRSGQLIDGAALSAPGAVDPTLAGLLVARDGQIARWDGARISREDISIFDGDVTEVAHLSEHRFVAVGGGPEAFVLERITEGGLWRKRIIFGYEVALGRVLRSVAVDGATVVAVGDAGLIVERDEDGVYRVTSPSSGPTLRAVDAYRGRVVAAGEAGEVLERGSSGWARVGPTVPDGPDLFTVAIAEDGSIWVGASVTSEREERCGGSFAVLRLTEGGWEELGRFPCGIGRVARAGAGRMWIAADVLHVHDGVAITPSDLAGIPAPIVDLWTDADGVVRAARSASSLRMFRGDLPTDGIAVNGGQRRAFALGPSYAIVGGTGRRIQRMWRASIPR